MLGVPSAGEFVVTLNASNVSEGRRFTMINDGAKVQMNTPTAIKRVQVKISS